MIHLCERLIVDSFVMTNLIAGIQRARFKLAQSQWLL